MAELKSPSSGVEERAESSDLTSALEAAEADAELDAAEADVDAPARAEASGRTSALDAAEAGADAAGARAELSGTTPALEAAEAEADAADAAEDRRPRMGVDARPEWSPDAHIEHGLIRPDGKSLVGYHRRPGGEDHGPEVFDESTRVDLPAGCYSGRWRMTDTDGGVVTKPNGNDLSKLSTFWPDDMTMADIDAATAEAYDHAVANGTADADGFRGIGAGHPVQAYFDGEGRIVTSFIKHNE